MNSTRASVLGGDNPCLPLHPKDASPEDHIPILITSAVLHEAEIARCDATPARDALAGVGTRVHRKALR